MTPTKEEIRAHVLKIFEQVRQSPGKPFDESRFQDFLIDPPAAKDQIRGTFKGSRKHGEYMNAIELKFIICFSDDDSLKSYSVDKLTSKISQKISKTRGNKIVVRTRLSKKDTYIPEILLTALMIFLVVIFRLHYISAFVILCWAIAVGWMINGRITSRKHDQLLYEKIMEQEKLNLEARDSKVETEDKESED